MEGEKKQDVQQPKGVPNSAAVLVLGIISIALCWCYGVIGIATGVIALVLGNKGKKTYEENPENYIESSYKNLKAGRICAIIGLSLSALYLIYIIFILATVGATFSALPWEEIIEAGELQRQ